MRISYNWLKDYVDFNLNPSELAEKLTMAGFEVEEIITTLPYFEGIVVGKVLSCSKHPDADKLSICEVEIPENTFQVICGAPNVATGQNIPFAQIGVKLPNGMKIKRAKIRGVESFGMICSEQELGISESSDGIWVLPEDWNIGDDVYSIMKQNQDYVLDLSITPNRPDAMSMIGIAREVAAITNSKLKIPQIDLNEVEEKAEACVQVKINNPEGCPRYAVKIIKNIKIESSPKWLAERLIAAGVRPINNIVDITNYVLMETGQPLHAFDYEQVKGSTIIVRDSIPGEKFTTLDEKERELPEDTVMICDAERPVAIGGIMGGMNSEVSDSTSTVLLESAYFNPVRIARSAKKLGLSTEANQRFERGANPNGVMYAAERAASLMEKIAGGEVVNGSVDIYPKKINQKEFNVRIDRINKVLGTSLSEPETISILSALEIEFKDGKVKVPTFRPDLEREIDIVEEIARMITFDKIPVENKCDIYYESKRNENDYLLSYLKKQFFEIGLTEVISNSMVSRESVINDKNNENTIPILNPISDDMNVMRTSLLPGLLKITAYNLNRNQTDIRIFELGRVFHKIADDMVSNQPYYISGTINGSRILHGWEGDTTPVDFYDIKGLVQSFFNKILLDNIDFIFYDTHVYLDKEQTLAIKIEDTIIGYFGRINSDVLKNFDIESEVFGFELNVDYILSKINMNNHYEPFSKYPYVEKDLAFVVDEDIPSEKILNTISKTGGNLVDYVDIFDLYKGENIEKGKKSLAFRTRFQSFEKTLKDKEIDAIVKNIINNVESKFKAKLRD